MKALNIVLDILPSHKDAKKEASLIKEQRQRLDGIVQALETTKAEIAKAHADYSRKIAQENAAAKDASSTSSIGTNNTNNNSTSGLNAPAVPPRFASPGANNPPRTNGLPIPGSGSTTSSTNNSTSQPMSISPHNPFGMFDPSLKPTPSQLTSQQHQQSNTSSQSSTTTITPAELYNRLSTTTERVLVLDIRPQEEYIQGHIRWKKRRRREWRGEGPVGGVICIEPDLLKNGVTASDIETLLAAFSLGDPRASHLFTTRDTFDLVVYHDQSSTTPSSSVSSSSYSLFASSITKPS
ncbi:hypothetical protein HK102_011824, partial [Quaeritorhiza haematococci]